MKITNLVPKMKVSLTQGKLEDQGITYNQAGVSYNDNYMYGGFYGLSDVQPLIAKVFNNYPRLKVARSFASLEDQGITYNQTGVKYNDNYAYGGIYGFTDVEPLISKVFAPVPRITGYADIYTKYAPPPANSGMLIGMLSLTYP